MSLELKNLVVLKQGTSIFDPVNIIVKPGEILTVMGPSGCGKSTLLSAVSGSLDSVFTLKGSICLYGKNIVSLPMEKRNIGILFQDDLLFPHMNTGSNLAFAIRDKMPKAKQKQIIDQALETAGMKGFETRDISSLSGGQKARISLLRSLLAKPAALLMDEPFSKLDKALKIKIQHFVFSRIKQMNIPALLVTHDPADCPEHGKIVHMGRQKG